MRHTEFPRVQRHPGSFILTEFRIEQVKLMIPSLTILRQPYRGRPNRVFFCKEAARLDSPRAR